MPDQEKNDKIAKWTPQRKFNSSELSKSSPLRFQTTDIKKDKCLFFIKKKKVCSSNSDIIILSNIKRFDCQKANDFYQILQVTIKKPLSTFDSKAIIYMSMLK